jgi:uncharacterized protein
VVDTHDLTLLIISLLAVVAGPLLYRVADRARITLVTLDGFVLMSVTGLVIVHIIPHAIAAAGPWALAPAALGFMVPGMIERSLTRAARQAHLIALTVALGGLLVHAFFDGVALATPAEAERGVSVLALAVAIHRLPVAITTWALVRPSYGTGLAVAILAGDATAVTCGYLMQGPAGLGSEPLWVHYFEALVGGSLMHVLIHRPTLSRPAGARERTWAGVAGVAALAAVIGLARRDAEMHVGSDGLGAGDYVMALARETAPALLAAFLLATLVQLVAPRLPARWLGGGAAAAAPLRGIGYGLTLPICSCGVTPMYRTLIEAGVPLSAALAFLVATPQLGLDALLLSFPLLGGGLALARIAGALAAALILGALLGRATRATAAPAAADRLPARAPLTARLRTGIRFGFAELVDHAAPWILVGFALAAVVAPLIDGDALAGLPPGLDVLLLALAGMPFYVSAAGMTPLVAVLLFKGMSPGAAVAFLITGTAINNDTYRMLRGLHGERLALSFAGGLALVAIGLGLAVNGVLGPPSVLADSRWQGWPGDAALAALAGVFALSMLRQGPRGFMDQIIDPYDKHKHGHDHDHDHDHAHEAAS